MESISQVNPVQEVSQVKEQSQLNELSEVMKQMSVKTTNIDRFYKEAMEDTNVVDCDYLRQQLRKTEQFDWEELSKPFLEIDFQKLSQTVPQGLVTGEWSLPKKTTQTGSTGIKKYSMPKGNVMTLGTGNYNGNNNLLLIKNVWSKFIQHGPSFSDKTKKSTTFKELQQMRTDMQYADFRKFVTANLTIDVLGESKSMQDPVVVEDIKLLELVRVIIGNQVKEVFGQEQKDPKLTYQTNGYIKRDYDKYYEQDVVKMTLAFDMCPIRENGDCLSIINVNNPYGYDDELQCTDIVEKCETIGDLMSSIQMKNMDIIICIDSCCTKKDGRSIQVMPKMKLHQIILHSKKQDNVKHVGLKIPSNKQLY